jgi:hypothetical protein
MQQSPKRPQMTSCFCFGRLVLGIGIVLSLCSCAFISFGHHQSPLISTLAPSRTVQLRFASEGCFHEFHYSLSFTGCHEGCRVTGIELPSAADPTPSVPGRPLPSVLLTAPEAAGIDRLFEFYRQGTRGGCTTVDHITIHGHLGGDAIFQEVFTDSSCSAEQQMGVITIPELVRRMKSARQ